MRTLTGTPHPLYIPLYFLSYEYYVPPSALTLQATESYQYVVWFDCSVPNSLFINTSALKILQQEITSSVSMPMQMTLLIFE